MNIPFFSIIIPVYNGLSHDLSICLDSIWNQLIDISLYEVICIDDCSTDNTRDWLKEEQEKHNNLIIIENKENLRQGGARNNGVKQARGKYIMFIDQDDYYHQNSIVKVYEHLQKVDVDILICDSAYQFKGYEHDNLQLNLPFRDVTDTVDFVKMNGWACAPWRMVFKKELWTRNNITFVDKVRLEDTDWAMRMYYYAETIQYQPILLVHYNKGETGTTDNMYRDIVILGDNIKLGNRIIKLANTIYLNSEIRSKVVDFAILYYHLACKYMLGLFCSISDKVDMIGMIPKECATTLFVKLAKKSPSLYAIVSNLAVPFFMLVRKIHRLRFAKKLQKND